MAPFHIDRTRVVPIDEVNLALWLHPMEGHVVEYQSSMKIRTEVFERFRVRDKKGWLRNDPFGPYCLADPRWPHEDGRLVCWNRGVQETVLKCDSLGNVEVRDCVRAVVADCEFAVALCVRVADSL